MGVGLPDWFVGLRVLRLRVCLDFEILVVLGFDFGLRVYLLQDLSGTCVSMFSWFGVMQVLGISGVVCV